MPPALDLILLGLGQWQQDRNRRRAYAATPCYECVDFLPCSCAGMIGEPPSGPKSRSRVQCSMFACQSRARGCNGGFAMVLAGNRHCSLQEKIGGCWARGDTTGSRYNCRVWNMYSWRRLLSKPQLVGLPWRMVKLKSSLSELGGLGDRRTTVEIISCG
jgi:hypothetical protein